MPTMRVNACSVAYEVIGDGRPWVITPGAALPEWAEIIERNPANRQRFLDQDPATFIATMERWMAV